MSACVNRIIICICVYVNCVRACSDVRACVCVCLCVCVCVYELYVCLCVITYMSVYVTYMLQNCACLTCPACRNCMCVTHVC